MEETFRERWPVFKPRPIPISVEEVDGLIIEKLNEGKGKKMPKGSKVVVMFTAKLPNGEIIDETYSRL